MSAAALTYYTKIRGSITQNFECLRQDKRQQSKDGETSLQERRLQQLYSPGEDFNPASKNGRLQLFPRQNTQHLFVENVVAQHTSISTDTCGN